MKKMILFGLILVGFQLAASAQDKRDTIRPHHKNADKVKIKEELGLSKEQGDKLKTINEESRNKMMTLRKDSSLSKEDRKAKAKELMKERNDQINAILTPDQQTKYRQMSKEAIKEGMHRKGKGGNKKKAEIVE